MALFPVPAFPSKDFAGLPGQANTPKESSSRDPCTLDPKIQFISTNDQSPHVQLHDTPDCEADYAVVSRRIMLSYFEQTDVQHRLGARYPHPDVASKVYAKMDSYHIPLPDRDLRKYADGGMVMACTSYRYITDIDHQVALSLYSCCMLISDDDNVDLQVLKEFVPRFYTRQPQLNPFLDLLVEVITVMLPRYYDTYGANSIVSGTMDYYNSELFLRTHPRRTAASGSMHTDGPGSPEPEAAYFVDFIRWKTGDGESYAAQLFPKYMYPDTSTYVQVIPYAVVFINFLNDIFSFYKEEKVGETNNYVSQYARAHGISKTETLEIILRTTIDVIHRTRDLLPENGGERFAWDEFVAGYTQFHLHTPRYFLDEIIPEFF